MSASELAPVPPTDGWSVQLEQLRARYRHVRPPILTALNILVLDPNISIDDAKAQAALRGIRITAASMASAKVLFSRMDAPTVPAVATNSASATNTGGLAKREPRRARQADVGSDAEALVRGFVAKLQTHGNAETDRLRDAMRKAVAVLQAAIGYWVGVRPSSNCGNEGEQLPSAAFCNARTPWSMTTATTWKRRSTGCAVALRRRSERRSCSA